MEYDLLLISSDNHYLYCHKIILYNFSQKFRGMISFHDENLESSILTLRLASNGDELTMLLEWMYFGHVCSSDTSCLCRLLLLADEYIVTTLTRRLETLILVVIQEKLDILVETLNVIDSIDTSDLKKLRVVSAALYILRYKDIVNNYDIDIVNNISCNIDGALLIHAFEFLLV